MNVIICGIYKITSPSGRVYVGESKNVTKRWKIYKKLRCKSQTKLYNSFLKYGTKEHTFDIIEECLYENLLCRERYWQDYYDVLNGGLNLKLTKCGDNKQVVSDNTKNKIIETKTGKKLTQAHKDNIRKGIKGIKRSRTTDITHIIIKCIESWDFETYGKITQSKIAKVTGFGIATIKRRSMEIKKVFSILNEENLCN